jgi:regulator of RNase E activity RraA
MDGIATRLQRLDCCAVSDAMDRLGIAGRVASGLEQRATTQRIAGRAVTCRLVSTAQVPSTGGAPRHLGTAAIEAAAAGDVIVVEQRTGIDAGSWGGILTLGARLRGVAGVVVDGPVRDIDEARGYGFPVYCNALTARTARGRVAELECNGPVTICGVSVNAGDYVLADASGVAFIPAGDAERVLDAAEAIAAREAAMAKALLAGQPIVQVMGADYEHMLRQPRKENR